MKKLLLVPIIALSLMTGCDINQPKMITLDRWLENAEDEKIANGWCNLYYKGFKSYDMDADEWDYENYVLKAIKENVTGNYTRKNKRIEDTDSEIFFVYLMQNKQDDADGCFLYVYENHIMTFTDFFVGKKYYSQRCYYAYDVEVGKKIIDAAVGRAKEIKDTYKQETALAKQEATIENFLTKAEEATTFSITYNNKSVEDENRSFLNALKGKEYRDNTDGTYTLYDSEVLATYQIDEHLLLRLGTENRGSNFNGERGNIVEVCYNYKPTFIPSAYYEEGKYGPRQRYAISQETHSELKQVLDSLVTE